MGARPILIAGLVVHALAIALLGLASSYWALMIFRIIGGAGQAVFHPADYAILSARIAKPKLGRAFGIHLVAGYIGWSLAPVTVLSLTALWDWRTALVVLGLAGLVLAAAMIWQRDLLSGEIPETAQHDAESGETRKGMAVFLIPAILMLFLFYVVISMAGVGIQTFSVVSIMDFHGASLAAANAALTAFLIAAGIGVLVGGVLADKTDRHHRVALVSFVLSAAFVGAIAVGGIPMQGVVTLMFLSGLFLGIVSPSRDIMVRNPAPPNSIGTVFGFVSAGFSFGGAIAPVLFGWVNDIERPELAFLLSGALMLMAIVTLYGVRGGPAAR